jgi:hypothetical protein
VGDDDLQRVVARGPLRAGDEAREALPVGVKHAHRRKARAGQLTRGLEQAIEHRFDVQLAELLRKDVERRTVPAAVTA